MITNHIEIIFIDWILIEMVKSIPPILHYKIKKKLKTILFIDIIL